ncbi:MAG: ABC transporter ATP-binding protein [Johnsonella sp.]|nr:ABC transporter ATP-binding protein [Johnsonella sp.]
MLKIRGLEKRYGKNPALSGLDMEVKEGAVYGLVGRNGAGKTTAMKIMAGLICPDKGEVKIGGRDIISEAEEIKERIGYVPDYCGFYNNLTVEEYMDFFSAAYGWKGLKGRKSWLRLIERVGLQDKLYHTVDELSRGMQQRLCLARGLIHDPVFLIMDEPTSGLDPASSYEFRNLIKSLGSEGKTILISSHMLAELSEICTDIGIIDHGRMIVSGSLNHILRQVEYSNPIKISILDGVSSALAVFRNNPGVRTISRSGHTFMLNFDGDRKDEADLLRELIEMEIPVREFVREPGDLESFFMQTINHREERTILENDY